MFRRARYAALMAVMILSTACSSGDLGGILGGGGTTDPGSSSYGSELRGTVDYVDTRDQFIQLTNVSGRSNLSNDSGGNRVRVYYDTRTSVEYQGRSYRPEDLERGDEIAIRVDDQNGRYTAQSIAVVRDVSGGSSSGTYGDTYDTRVRGTVSYVDTRNRTIELSEGTFSNQTTVVAYDTNTAVDYDGRRYRAEDLQRGDEVEVTVREVSGRRVASAIRVTRNAAGGSSSSTAASRVRGVIRTVDTSRRTITLDNTSWTGSRFDSGSGSSTSVVVQYDTNVPVHFQGRTYAVTNLERGDEVEIEVRSVGRSELLADRITVLRDRNSF